VTSRELIRWSSLHERRARRTRWTTLAVAGGAALAAFVAWRAEVAGVVAASHAWLAGTLAAFALAFLRVPFHLYWRADAALLAQLPIDGGPLFDAALVRCIRAAAVTTLVALLGALPLAALPADVVAEATRPLHATPIAGASPPGLTPLALYLHHAALAGVLGLCAAFLLPAVATWAASLVTSGASVLEVATALGGAPARSASPPASSGAVLGALPGFVSSVVFALVLLATPWLVNAAAPLPAPGVLAALAVASVLAVLAARALAQRVMGTILRDVSALDRQRLATLEIRPPTAIEQVIARLLGDAGLPYRKDARLMRRRFPMAYALGALAFIVLAVVGLARPRDPMPWLVATLAGAAMYSVALAGRLRRPPIELPRLSATLPISAAALSRAKLGWAAGWWVLFVLVPGAFALARVREPAAAVLLVAATVVALVAGTRGANRRRA